MFALLQWSKLLLMMILKLLNSFTVAMEVMAEVSEVDTEVTAEALAVDTEVTADASEAMVEVTAEATVALEADTEVLAVDMADNSLKLQVISQ